MDQRKQPCKWLPVLGPFEQTDTDLIFKGYEYEPTPAPESSVGPPSPTDAIVAPAKVAAIGEAISDQRFTEGRISTQIEFAEVQYQNKATVDIRSLAEIILQYDPASEDMLNVGIGAYVEKDKIYQLFAFRQWTAVQDAEANQPIASSFTPKKSWRVFRAGGDKSVLQPNRPYTLEVVVKGSSASLSLDGVEVGRQVLPFQLAGKQVGVFCVGPRDIHFRNFAVEPVRPQAFVVMQFNTPEYEALFADVIGPVCDRVGLRAYRADQTYLPGLVVADIIKQITESRVIIAEITPVNGNVYYEVGYADALGKPVILVADKNVSQLPFDVRPYRTVFYENSIGGKTKVEALLIEYLRNIMAQSVR